MSVAEVSWLPLLLNLFTDTEGSPIQPSTTDHIIPIRQGSNLKPPLYAVIIGINTFLHDGLTQLYAAVADAIRFKNYLQDELSVPKENITMLLEEKATRANIISAIQSLGANNEINRGDPIVIFFAGHGVEMAPPPHRRVNGPKIQCIIPRDTTTKKALPLTIDVTADTTEIYPPIPDYTIGALMDKLCLAKGDNITLILDCCHSAGGSRDAVDGVRSVSGDILPPLPANLDLDISGTQPAPSANEPGQVRGFAGQAMGSHVLLAACRSDEKAYEETTAVPPYGNFTDALLNQFQKWKIDALTYKGCMERFPELSVEWKPQHPVCEGMHVNRIFFNALVPGADNSFIPIKYQQPKNYQGTNSAVAPAKKYYLEAGSSLGIAPGSVFEIYKEPFADEKQKMGYKVVVSGVGPFSATLRNEDGTKLEPGSLPDFTYGLQTGYSQEQALDVYLEPGLLKVVKPDNAWTRAFSGNEYNVVLRPAELSVAQLIAGLSEDRTRAVFTMADRVAAQYGAEKLHKSVELAAGNMMAIMRAAARWNWHLRRTPVDNKLRVQVAVEFYRLEDIGSDITGQVVWGPVGGNLIKNGVVEIEHEDKKERFGMKITNNTEPRRHLYVYPFYFSNSKLSVEPKYTQIYGNSDPNPTLPRDETPFAKDDVIQKANYITIGYGSGGVEPLYHTLEEDQDVAVGTYKLFLTSDATDFSSVAQESPFANFSHGPREAEDKLAYDRVRDIPIWDTVSFSIVTQRPFTRNPGQSIQTKSATHPLLPFKVESRLHGDLKVECPSNITPAHKILIETDVLTADLLDKANGVKIHTCSMQTVGHKAKGNGAWFMISLNDADDNFKSFPGEERELYWRSHSNEKGGRYGAECTWATAVLDRQHEIWRYAEPGDKIHVTAVALGKGWKNRVTRGVLEFW